MNFCSAEDTNLRKTTFRFPLKRTSRARFGARSEVFAKGVFGLLENHNGSSYVPLCLTALSRGAQGGSPERKAIHSPLNAITRSPLKHAKQIQPVSCRIWTFPNSFKPIPCTWIWVRGHWWLFSAFNVQGPESRELRLVCGFARAAMKCRAFGTSVFSRSQCAGIMDRWTLLP